MPDMVRETDLYLENAHVPYERCNDLWSPDPGVRKTIIGQHLNWLEDCARFEIPILVMHLTKGDITGPPNDFGLKAMERILRRAQELGVLVAVENTRKPEYFDRVLAEFDSPYLGVCYDSSHDWLYQSEQTEILYKWSKRLFTVHLSDNDGQEDRHWLPGEGIIEWDRVKTALQSNIRSGCLTLEVFPKSGTEGEAPEEFLRKAYDVLKTIL